MRGRSGDSIDSAWQRWLALAMALFAAVPLVDGHVATGGGMLAFFAGVLVLGLVVGAEDEGHPGHG